MNDRFKSLVLHDSGLKTMSLKELLRPYSDLSSSFASFDGPPNLEASSRILCLDGQCLKTAREDYGMCPYILSLLWHCSVYIAALGALENCRHAKFKLSLHEVIRSFNTNITYLFFPVLIFFFSSKKLLKYIYIDISFFFLSCFYLN